MLAFTSNLIESNVVLMLNCCCCFFAHSVYRLQFDDEFCLMFVGRAPVPFACSDFHQLYFPIFDEPNEEHNGSYLMLFWVRNVHEHSLGPGFDSCYDVYQFTIGLLAGLCLWTMSMYIHQSTSDAFVPRLFGHRCLFYLYEHGKSSGRTWPAGRDAAMGPATVVQQRQDMQFPYQIILHWQHSIVQI